MGVSNALSNFLFFLIFIKNFMFKLDAPKAANLSNPQVRGQN